MQNDPINLQVKYQCTLASMFMLLVILPQNVVHKKWSLVFRG